jgi:hypothetical protein
MERLRSPREAGELLGVTPGTLAVWRATKRYALKYVKVGRSVKYRLEDLLAFATANTKPGSTGKGGKAK